MILTFENRAERVGICANNRLDYEGQAGTTSGGTQAALTHCQEPEDKEEKQNNHRIQADEILAFE